MKSKSIQISQETAATIADHLRTLMRLAAQVAQDSTVNESIQRDLIRCIDALGGTV